ncbi:hypothetical protein AB6A40_010008 [Gnathostoma spinigerum]|uniref:tRNA-dihydrouridine(16/17) synthase [NAD(P)(+)] n=1 Tax=Gnathostoma spinigerum TaxID=75299 RepID=A0ABD6F0P0_9BILA
MMMRDHGADLCFTPMIHAHLFVSDITYRRTAFSTCAEDRPLIVQFCANNPETLLVACNLVVGFCDGVDLNLGCPQLIAKRGHYGAYLQEDRELVCHMVSLVHSCCALPLSCKIRILDDVDETIAYAKSLVDAGACMLTVHGRTREQRGPNTGLADWNIIRRVVESVNVPVLANGNIQMPGDVESCLKVTRASAVMSAEGILANPYLFEGRNEFNWEVARVYLKYAADYNAAISQIRGHLFRICHHSLLEFSDLREKLSYVCTLVEFNDILDDIERRVKNLILENNAGMTLDCKLNVTAVAPCPVSLPHWVCKPYFRPVRDDAVQSESIYREKRRAELNARAAETGLSKRQLRKRERRKIEGQKVKSIKQSYPKCARCSLPASQGCVFSFCRNCCRYKTAHERLRCNAHRFHFDTKVPKCCRTEEASLPTISSCETGYTASPEACVLESTH